MLLGTTVLRLKDNKYLLITQKGICVYNSTFKLEKSFPWPLKIGTFSACMMHNKIYVLSSIGIYIIHNPFSGSIESVFLPQLSSIINASCTKENLYVLLKHEVKEFNFESRTLLTTAFKKTLIDFQALDDGSFVYIKMPSKLSIFPTGLREIGYIDIHGHLHTELVRITDKNGCPHITKVAPTRALIEGPGMCKRLVGPDLQDCFEKVHGSCISGGFVIAGKGFKSSNEFDDDTLFLSTLPAITMEDTPVAYITEVEDLLV